MGWDCSSQVASGLSNLGKDQPREGVREGPSHRGNSEGNLSSRAFPTGSSSSQSLRCKASSKLPQVTPRPMARWFIRKAQKSVPMYKGTSRKTQ